MPPVFEVIDSSNDEMYFTLGIYMNLMDAKAAVKDFCSDTSSNATDYGCDGAYEEISVEERKIGWTGRGEVVYKINRENIYNQETGEDFWVNTETQL